MKEPIVLLHGWGLQGNKYKEVASYFTKRGHAVFTPDMPGFGSEKLSSSSLFLKDYVTFIHNVVKKNKLKDIVFIGHSFGGRVLLKYVATYPENVKKIIMTGVPIIRHTSLRKKTGFLIAKIGGFVLLFSPSFMKKLFRKILYRFIGEWDYYKAGPLQDVFKNIISEDLLQYAKKITVPTFLIWGENDTFTPATDVEKIKKIIPHAKSLIVEGSSHKLPYEHPLAFIKAVEKFL